MVLLLGVGRVALYFNTRTGHVKGMDWNVNLFSSYFILGVLKREDPDSIMQLGVS